MILTIWGWPILPEHGPARGLKVVIEAAVEAHLVLQAGALQGLADLLDLGDVQINGFFAEDVLARGDGLQGDGEWVSVEEQISTAPIWGSSESCGSRCTYQGMPRPLAQAAVCSLMKGSAMA